MQWFLTSIQTSTTSRTMWLPPMFSPPSTSSRGTIKSRCYLMASLRPPLSRPSGSSSSSGCPLVCPTLAPRPVPMSHHMVRAPALPGLINFYCLFLRGVAGFLLPLTDALQCLGKSFVWPSLIDQAYNTPKAAFSTATKLESPQTDFPISLMVDVSNTHVGTVLQHFHMLSWAPLSFSKKLLPAETRYSAFDRELLAVYSATFVSCWRDANSSS